MRKQLIQLIGGLAMLAAGGYWFLSGVSVTTSYFGLMMGSVHINGGLIIVPFLVGIIWLFIDHKSLGAKLVTGLGLLIIIAAIISSTRFVLRNMNLFEYLLILILIIGGAVLILKTLLGRE